MADRGGGDHLAVGHGRVCLHLHPAAAAGPSPGQRGPRRNRPGRGWKLPPSPSPNTLSASSDSPVRSWGMTVSAGGERGGGGAGCLVRLKSFWAGRSSRPNPPPFLHFPFLSTKKKDTPHKKVTAQSRGFFFVACEKRVCRSTGASSPTRRWCTTC